VLHRVHEFEVPGTCPLISITEAQTLINLHVKALHGVYESWNCKLLMVLSREVRLLRRVLDPYALLTIMQQNSLISTRCVYAMLESVLRLKIASHFLLRLPSLSQPCSVGNQADDQIRPCNMRAVCCSMGTVHYTPFIFAPACH